MNNHCFFIGVTLDKNPPGYHFSALARSLASRGHQVVILTPHRKIELENRHGNPAVYTWPSERPTHLRDAMFLWRLIRQYRPSCLIANFGAVNIMTLVGWLARVPVRVAWYHTLTAQLALDNQQGRARKCLLRFRKRWVYAACTHLVANSKASAQDVQNEYRVPSSKCQVHYLSLPDPSLIGVSIRTANLCCVGRLQHSKGQDVLIRAIRLLGLNLNDLRVEFVGEGPEENCYRRLACELGLEDQCVFLGRLKNHDEVLKRMANATVTAVPSRAEAFGMVVLESLAMGTPVVASNVGGIPEVVRDGIDGFLVPPDDPAALASKLKLLLSDDELRRRMSLNARERFLSTFEQGKIVEEQADWLEQIAGIRNKNSHPDLKNGAPA